VTRAATAAPETSSFDKDRALFIDSSIRPRAPYSVCRLIQAGQKPS
jgi:hypothetical protein